MTWRKIADDPPPVTDCEIVPWFGDDYGARCRTCGRSKRGMMANIDIYHECNRVRSQPIPPPPETE